MRGRGLAWIGRTAALGLVLLAGCGQSDVELRIDAVEPQRIHYGVVRKVLLRGSFVPLLSLEFGDDIQPSLNADFRVMVGEEAANGIRFVSPELLEIDFPIALETGRHDVKVTDPRDREALLVEGVEVFINEPTRIAFTTPAQVVTPDVFTAPIRVQLQDDEGMPARYPGETLFRLTGPSSGFLNINGVISSASTEYNLPAKAVGFDFSFKDSTPGFHTITVSASGFEPITQTVIVGERGSPARVRFTSRSPSTSAGEVLPLTVEVVDAIGGAATLPEEGVRVELSVDSVEAGLATHPDGPFQRTVSVLLEELGRSTAYFRSTRATPEKVQARAFLGDAGSELAPDSIQVSVSAAPLNSFEVSRVGQEEVQAGVPRRFRIRAVDAYGNTVRDWNGGSGLSFHGGIVEGRTPGMSEDGHVPKVDEANGMVERSVVFTRAEPTVLVVTDRAKPPHVGSSESFPVRPGPFSRYVVSGPEGAPIAGEPFAVTIEALDAYGNQVREPREVALSALGMSAEAIRPAVSGSFSGSTTIPVTLTSAGRTRLLVHDGGAARLSPEFEVRSGPAARFELVTPACVSLGQPFALEIRAVDAFDNPATGYTGRVALSAQLDIAPPLSPHFSEGAVSIPEVRLSGATPPTKGCIPLQAADPVDPRLTGATCVSVADPCP